MPSACSLFYEQGAMGSERCASCFAMGLCRRPRQSSPTSIPVAFTILRRSTNASSARGESSQSTSGLAFVLTKAKPIPSAPLQRSPHLAVDFHRSRHTLWPYDEQLPLELRRGEPEVEGLSSPKGRYRFQKGWTQEQVVLDRCLGDRQIAKMLDVTFNAGAR